ARIRTAAGRRHVHDRLRVGRRVRGRDEGGSAAALPAGHAGRRDARRPAVRRAVRLDHAGAGDLVLPGRDVPRRGRRPRRRHRPPAAGRAVELADGDLSGQRADHLGRPPARGARAVRTDLAAGRGELHVPRPGHPGPGGRHARGRQDTDRRDRPAAGRRPGAARRRAGRRPEGGRRRPARRPLRQRDDERAGGAAAERPRVPRRRPRPGPAQADVRGGGQGGAAGLDGEQRPAGDRGAGRVGRGGVGNQGRGPNRDGV
ncbi:MAG: hypothetical protein AVDCRST_MAG64-3167, partial [uncultured Phycisphaerae bacterium]